MTMHLLTGHMLDKWLYLNVDLKKSAIHHILLTRYQMITICLPNLKKRLHGQVFDRRLAQVCGKSVVEGTVRTTLCPRKVVHLTHGDNFVNS